MDVQTQLPEAVRKQAERAEEIHRKAYPDQYPKPAVSPTERAAEQTDKETPAPSGTEGAPKPGVSPAPSRTEGPGEQPKTGKEPKPGETSNPGETVRVEALQGKETPAAEDWKQKYETLQGKYNAEVPQLHMTVASLKNQIRELQNAAEVRPEQQSVEKPAEKKEPAKEEEDRILTTFKEEYPDIFEAVAKMIGKTKGEEKPKEKPKVESKEEKAPPSTIVNPRGTFDFYLNRDVPDWRQVNTDPEFIQFLRNPDPAFPGMTKLESIQAAYDAADFTTVIGHFRDFKAGKQPVRPDQGTAAPALHLSGTGPAAPAPEKELSPEEKFLAPPKGGRGPAGADTGPAVTPHDLAKFYDEARRGLWGPITEEKFRKEEARLLAAMNKKN
jgi:hypothetical protein